MAKTALVIPAAYHSAKSHSGGLEGPANLTSIAPIISQLDPKHELGFEGMDADSVHGLKIISRGTAILLLIVYIAYLFFQVSTDDSCTRHTCAPRENDPLTYASWECNLAQDPRVFVHAHDRGRGGRTGDEHSGGCFRVSTVVVRVHLWPAGVEHVFQTSSRHGDHFVLCRLPCVQLGWLVPLSSDFPAHA